jgi:hypothetical protein
LRPAEHLASGAELSSERSRGFNPRLAHRRKGREGWSVPTNESRGPTQSKRIGSAQPAEAYAVQARGGRPISLTRAYRCAGAQQGREHPIS